MQLIPEFRIAYFLVGAVIFMGMKVFEKLKFFGAQELPRKDSLMVFYFMLGGAFMWIIVIQMMYFISLPPQQFGIILDQLLSWILLVISAVIFFSNALISPSKNFLISIIVGSIVAVVLTIVVVLFGPIIIVEGYSVIIWGFITHTIGLIVGIIVYIILYYTYKEGLTELWTAKGYWKVINHYWLLIPVWILLIIEMVLSLRFLSLLTIFFYL
ncbi:MAG: hypothetical protein ACTSPY_11310 [Candidatus Helarchaeota archaeon]